MDDLTDARLEREIQAAYKDFDAAKDYETRQAAWMRMGDLIAQRSAAQVEKMERERGLT